jgi:ParB family chromosome partitioning protein
VRFVGLDTYRQAGGGIRRDLFAEGDAGTYLTDAALLETLVRDKLATLAEDVRAEGWAWVDAVPHRDLCRPARLPERPAPAPRADHPRSPPHRASLQTRLEKIDAEAGRSRWTPRTRTRPSAAGAKREAGGRAVAGAGGCLAGLRPDVRAVAGAIVTIDRNGEAVIHRGLLREAEAKALRTLESCGARFRQRRRSRERRRRRGRRRRAQGREPCPTGWRSG